MESLFLQILNMSITASWMIAAVILLRLALKKAPKYIRIFMWLLVGLRLSLPISFESILSLVPSSNTISHQNIYSNRPSIQSGIEIINQSVNPVIQNMRDTNQEAGTNLLQTLTSSAAIIWAAGVALILIYLFISYFQISRRVRTAVHFHNNIWKSESVTSPFILGLVKPRIYIPFLIDYDDMSNIIAHENAHLCRKDHWIKPLGFIILAIYWFNPLIWLSYILMSRDIELACDERVVSKMSPIEKKIYSRSLVNCSVSQKLISVCPLAFGEVGIKQRVKVILNYRKPTFWIILISIIVCIAIGVCFLTNPKIKDKQNSPELNELLLSHLSYDYGQIITTIAVNNAIYMVTDELVTLDKIEGQIGLIERQISPRPERNGDIAINVSSSKNLLLNGFGAVFQINGLDPSDAVAVQIDAENYYLCSFYCCLPNPLNLAQPTSAAQLETLDKAIRSAILQQNQNATIGSEYQTEAHTILKTVDNKTQVTAYLVAMYLEYSQNDDGSLEKQRGNQMPIALTFTRDAAGALELIEYWIPKEGDDYGRSIRSKFPEDIVQAALESYTFSDSLEKICEGNANRYFASKKPVAVFQFDSISQYIQYDLPAELIVDNFNRELGSLGGNLFGLKATRNFVAKSASDSTPPGWHSYGGAEIFYQLNCQFVNGELKDVSPPWNHAAYLTNAESIEGCAASAVILEVSFDLYTAPEAFNNHITKDNQTSKMWYVFFAQEDSKISYAIYLNAEHFSKETTIALAKSVKFSDNAFSLVIQ